MNRHAIIAVLERWRDYDWTLQGFGMFRCYLTPDVRLHVWDDRYAVPGVSLIHTHPWNFSSTVVLGWLTDITYRLIPYYCSTDSAYKMARIRCGEGGGLEGDPETVWLQAKAQRQYKAGQWYTMGSTEIHHTIAGRSTVTIVTRQVPQGGNADCAQVFWPARGEWVSAEPARPRMEVLREAMETALWRHGEQQ